MALAIFFLPLNLGGFMPPLTDYRGSNDMGLLKQGHKKDAASTWLLHSQDAHPENSGATL